MTSKADTRPHEDVVEDERRELPAGGSRDAGHEEAVTGRRRPRLSLPLVPLLVGLLVLLLAAAGFLWSTRPDASAVRTADQVEALQAARSGVVDLTSFDHLTLDDDIEQIRRVATGDLRDEAIARLEDNREQLMGSEAIVNTEVVGAGVTRAGESAATVLLVIQSTQESNATERAQVLRYRIEVQMTRREGRWVFSGITGR